MRYLRYAPAGHVTGARLGDFMGISSGRSETESDERIDYLIRWGYRGSARWTPDVTTINRRSAMNDAAGRLRQLRTLRRAGLNIPQFSRSPEGLDLPMLGRSDGDSQTMGGGGIEFIDSYHDADGYDIYTEWIEKDREFRAHVIGGRVVKLSEKVPDEASFRQRVIWNFENGFTFRNPRSDVPESVRSSAVASVGAFDLDFGAVDIILSENEPYMLEINTAPGLSDSSLETYATHLGRLVGLNRSEMPGWEEAERE